MKLKRERPVNTEYSQSPLCLAPWRSISIRPNGNVIPDGQYETPYGNINHQSLKDIFESKEIKFLQKSISNKEFPRACQSCQKKELTIGHSRRIFFEHKIRQFTPDQELDENSPVDIHYLDLNLSNRCNLKCRMCSSHSSSAWVPEEKQLLNLKTINFRLNKYPKLHEVDYDNVLKNFDYPEYFQNLKGIALQGGEPLMAKRNIMVLEKMVEWGLASQITIDLSTNGTIISPQIRSLIEKFRQVDLYISIEAPGDLYQYIRGDNQFSIKDLEKNLIEFREISNLNLSFAVTSCIYNILHLSSLLDWYEQVREPSDELVMSNTVVRPEYLSFQILPRELKDLAYDKRRENQVLERIYSKGHRKIGDPGKELILSSLKKEIYSEEEKARLLEQFFCFNDAVVKLRKSNLRQLLPEIDSLRPQKIQEQHPKSTFL